ncbi:MAG: glycosyltransferase [Bacteroidetes bacterium]|nr:glycosyltransferase [Bacteroidota bacterium]
MYKDRKISIGIYAPAFATLADVQRTLDTIALSRMPDAFSISVLADGNGPDAAKGKAYCFNRLVSQTGIDYFVLLEAGLLLGPRCLEQLVTALEEHPGAGLAGPSCNTGWNQQSSLLPSLITQNFREIAAHLDKRYGGELDTLEPLYSLSDFCYVVKREVIESIGGADEAYGLTPCWEMDFNIRAARAGYKGIWVKGAFAWRSLSWPAEDLDKGRQIYQRRFCSRQQSAASTPFREHCRGDGCSNFADPGLIRLKIDLPIQTAMAPLTQAGRALPLVSCVMPTAGRPQFIKKAIHYFLQQDYTHKELIVVYNEPADLPADLETDHRVRLVRSGAKSIGAKRNEGCRQAAGLIIAQWDDDDIYHPQRLSRQVEPILEGTAEVTGLHSFLFYEAARERCWACSPELFRRLFLENIAAGTLVYLKSYWTKESGYPEISLREDAEFMCRILRAGGRLQKMDGRDLFIYYRHEANTWKFRMGSLPRQNGWSEAALPAWAAGACPLVSCIMPTANRQLFLPSAIRYFQQQDYANTELIIVDNGNTSVESMIPADSRIRYVRLPANKATVGQLRNYACEMAKGEIIVHWDDDDWYGPDWVSRQVRSLQASGADITGLAKVLFYAPHMHAAWKYHYPEKDRPWVAGATMAYRRSYWLQHRFRDMRVGEDNDFVWRPGTKVFAHDHEEAFVAFVHPANTSPKNTRDGRWHPYPVDRLINLLPSDRVGQPKVYDAQ